MEFLEIFALIRRRMWMIVGLCFVATIAGFAASYLVGQSYEASALVLVRPQKPIEIVTSTMNKELLDFPLNQTMSVETPGKTYIEIISSDELVGKVVAALELDRQEETEEEEPESEFGKWLDDIKDQLKTYATLTIQYLKYGKAVEENDFERAVNEVKNNISLKTQEDTFVFTITFTGDDAQTTADVANTMADLFLRYMEDLHSSETGHVVNQLKERLAESKKQLALRREQLEAFKKESFVFEQETEYAEKLDVISQLEVELEKLESQLAVNQGTLSNRGLVARRDALREAISNRKAELANQPELERQLSFLRLDVDVARSAYEAVAKELEEAEIKGTSRAPEIRMISRAVPPSLPAKPIRVRYALFSLIAALVIGTVLAFFLEYIDQRVRGVDDVERVLGMRVLATIPRFPRRLQW